MKTDIELGSAITKCPSCGGHAAQETVTVNSGPWERQFLECSTCGQAFVADWRNTHYQGSGDTGTRLVDLSEAAA